MAKDIHFAQDLHKQVPPDWYHQSIKVDLLQKYWHKRRFSEVAKLITPTGGKVLDVGCADGTFSKIILDKSQADELMGIDVSEKSVAWAKKYWAKTSKMKFLVMDAHELTFRPETFNLVVALEMLEHVYSPEKVLREIKRVLKKDGTGIFLVPSDSGLFKLVWFLWQKFYPRGWVWKETHIQTYKNNFLPKLCKKVGFKIEVEKKFLLGMLHLVKIRKV